MREIYAKFKRGEGLPTEDVEILLQACHEALPYLEAHTMFALTARECRDDIRVLTTFLDMRKGK